MLIEKTIRDQGPVYKTSKKLQQYIKRQELLEENQQHLLSCVLYFLSAIKIATGFVCPSQTTIGEIVNRNRDTARKLLNKLVEMGWIAGWEQRNYDTCVYDFGDLTPQEFAIKFRKIKRPRGFKVPKWLWGMIMGNLTEIQARILLKYDITHESSLKRGERDKKYIENLKKRQKKQLKCKFGSPDLGITKTLIQKFELPKQQTEFLARNNVRVISLAIEDVETYTSKFQKKISNPFGFLLSRCKHHQKVLKKEKLQAKKTQKGPKELIEWAKETLSKISKLKFVQSTSEVDLADCSHTFVNFMIHKNSPEKSKLSFWKKVHGQWVDKAISPQNERFQELVMEFLT